MTFQASSDKRPKKPKSHGYPLPGGNQLGSTPHDGSVRRKPKRIRSWLRNLGPPQYNARNREAFEQMLRTDPDQLHCRVVYSVLSNLQFGPKEMSRFLFNVFGARASELNALHACAGMSEMMAKIQSEYELPEPVDEPVPHGGDVGQETENHQPGKTTTEPAFVATATTCSATADETRRRPAPPMNRLQNQRLSAQRNETAILQKGGSPGRAGGDSAPRHPKQAILRCLHWDSDGDPTTGVCTSSVQ